MQLAWAGRVAVALLLLSAGAPAGGAGLDRRALIIGINAYGGGKPGIGRAAKRTFPDLAGAVADAGAFRDLLIARYGFKPDEILFLSDGQATRARVLQALDGWLLKDAARGSLRLFYFAGHGSQLENSKSPEADKQDETLVPADSRRGVEDIRDKVLARSFDRAARAGVELTVVLDSCHSGSATRGLKAGRPRTIAPLAIDVADPEPAPDPTRSGALILAAAQDRQLANEVEEDGKPHGAFTLALIQALSSLPVDESLELVFRKAKALMQRDGRGQEPDLRGPEERKKRSLVGARRAPGPSRPTVAVRNVKGGQVFLQGGRAEELAPGCELVARGTKPGQGPRLRVAEVMGLSSSRAAVVGGSPEAVKPGDLYELDRWVAPERPNLTVWTPSPASRGEIAAAVAVFNEFRRKHPELAISTDPTALAPSHVVSWDGQGWSLGGPGPSRPLGRQVSVTALEAAAAAVGTAEKPVFFFQIPPPVELLRALELGAQSRNSAVAVERKGNAAQYLLAGRLDGARPSYTWVQLGLSPPALRNGTLLPFRGDWIEGVGPDGAAELTEQAVKLARIRGWLVLENARESFFPYRLALRDQGGKLRLDGVIKEDEVYRVALRSEGPLPPSVFQRYIYVFIIDQQGKATRLFPPGGGGGGENRLPHFGTEGPPREFDLPAPFKVSKPFGTDSYVLLATEEPLSDAETLEFDGVQGRTRGGGPVSPLGRLLASTGRRTRGAEPVAVPTNWSIDRITFKSEARSAP
jgi:hypothetical protein